MSDNNSEQVKILQHAIIDRAKDLTEEHIKQGEMSRNRIMDDAREKVKLMEQKKLLLATEQADREYQKRVQAKEIQFQAELDRNRWALVQNIITNARKEIKKQSEDADNYLTIFTQLLENGSNILGLEKQLAQVSQADLNRLKPLWAQITKNLSAKVTLLPESCECSGGVRLFSVDKSIMIDNTFEGIIDRNHDELMQLCFKQLFSKVQSMGGTTHG